MKKYLSRKFIFSIFIISVVLISKKNVVCAYNPELVRNMPSINGSVFASVIDGDDLYIGGIFDEVGGLTRNGIAKISISTGEVDADFNPALFADSEGYGVGVVRALSLFEDYLYVGGGFRFLGTDYVGEFVRLDKNTGLMDLSCIPNVHTFWQDTVYSIYVDSTGDIYLGGSFNEVGSVHRFGLAKLTSSCSLVDGWSADLPVESLNQTIGSVNSIIGLDDYIYVGGQFSEIKGVERYNLAKVSKSDGSIDTSFVPNPSDRVYALSFYDNKLYVGGAFSEIGGVEILEFARLDPESGAVDLSCNPEVVSPPPAVEFTVGALKIDNDGNIYLGGDFVGVDGKDRYSIARLDSSCNVDETFSQGIDPDYEMNYG